MVADFLAIGLVGNGVRLLGFVFDMMAGVSCDAKLVIECIEEAGATAEGV